ncbi:MAG: urea ABC transporter substrate-binding protein [Magnetovibrionaceae bacterium]
MTNPEGPTESPSRVVRVFGARHRYYLGALLAAMFGFIAAALAPTLLNISDAPKRSPIKVGVLHSLSGTMALSESPVAEATIFAIRELNAKGGVLGRKVEPILVDGRSDWTVFAEEADRLIAEQEVSAIFGCWTSACRKTVKPVFERHDHVLFYPVQYEGLEQSPNIIYTGAAPNQQIIPATKWSIDNLGRRIFLVGSDYVFPRTANAIIRLQVSALNGEIVGEDYQTLGGGDFAPIIERIKLARPDVIFNTINGDSNVAFYQQLRDAGILPEAIPVMSFSLAESEARAIGPELVAGDYAARNYFQTVDSQENRDFLARLRGRFGDDVVTNAPMEAAYFGVLMWAQAVEEAGSAQFRDYRATLPGQSMRAPGGIVYIDPENQHTWRRVLIAQAQPEGTFRVVWNSQRPIRPVPYPGFRSKAEWEAFLEDLYTGWGNHWAAQEALEDITP